MFSRLINSIFFRARMLQYGIWYSTSSRLSLDSIRVAGKRLSMSYPSEEQTIHEHELSKILFEDCYGLCGFKKPLDRILDIGANIGLFAIAARHRNRNAIIHSYEPNYKLAHHLKSHCDPLNVHFFLEAVGRESGQVDLLPRLNSLHSVSKHADQGSIRQTSFREAVERIGGTVDLLKLDCEGAEWELLEDIQTWARIRNLTMEYHLWASPGVTVDLLKKKIENFGFECISVAPSEDGTFGLLRATNQAFQ